MPRADRLLRLLQILSGKRAWSMSELAAELEMSPRSIYRDLNDLESRGIPLDREEGRYRVSSDATVRPIPLTDRERVILALTLENGMLAKSAFAKPLRSLKTKLTAAHALPAAAVRIAGPDRSGEIDEAIVDMLERAIALRHSVSIHYHSLTGRQRRWRGLDPWMVMHRSEAWYVVGRCHTHDEPRVFRLDRIRGLLPIGSTFERPDFDAEVFFSESWGVVRSGEKHEVAIRFEESVAPLILYAQHHPHEAKELLDDGSVEYRLRVASLDEIARWICGFGGDAQVIAPAALAQLVHEIAAGAANAHRQRRAAMSVRAPRRR
jgi:predicted DNA-binding transcriptional regulator YafY